MSEYIFIQQRMLPGGFCQHFWVKIKKDWRTWWLFLLMLWEHNVTIQWNTYKRLCVPFTRQSRVGVCDIIAQAVCSGNCRKWTDYIPACMRLSGGAAKCPVHLKTLFLIGGYHKREVGVQAVLEVRASGSWWTSIDWRGTWRYSCSRSALIFCKWRAGRMREPDQGELPGYLLKYPEVFFSFFFLGSTDLPRVQEICLFRH